MPENNLPVHNNNNGVNTSPDTLEDAMWRLKIQTQDLQDGVSAQTSPYPDRPGEPDCIYYLRTGLCGYGTNCRFNHPPYSGGQVAQYGGELPERTGQPDCQYFLKTGTCKFGATCKYNHPRDKHIAAQVPLNILGLPMRQEEKPCPYYMRNWSCKFGVACKFHHPQPSGAVVPMTGYGSTSSSVAPPSYAGGLPAWSLPRTPFVSGVRMQGPQAYMPVVVSPSQGWNSYTGTMSQASSNFAYNNRNQGESGSIGQLPLLSSTIIQLPERPEQSECQYYMKTGTCKFGPTCKYHHPKERMPPMAAGTLGPYGLPLRPGQAVCTFYSMYGICKFGSTCKYDHPMTGFYNYGVGVNVPTLTMPEPTYSYQQTETSPSKLESEHQNVDISEDHSPTQASPTSLEQSQEQFD